MTFPIVAEENSDPLATRLRVCLSMNILFHVPNNMQSSVLLTDSAPLIALLLVVIYDWVVESEEK